ncbi:MAG TPA: uroporphyrinogen-III synthase [Terriglobia bacterium]|nr:uroporphyrinogen-III synthase [Terriglobia bacterium]
MTTENRSSKVETPEALPLQGKRIVITRARDQAAPLAGALEALGAAVISIPTIEICDPPSWAPLDDAIRRLEEFDYLVLTSANGAQRFLGRLQACGRGVDDLARLEIGAIGPATAEALTPSGVNVSFVPDEYRAEGLIQFLDGRDLKGKRFLIPRAKVARDLVPRVLGGRGAQVEVVEAYETAAPEFARGELRRLLSPPPDMVTFTSSSTASNFAALLGREEIVLVGVAVASIGPVTSATVAKLGWKVAVEARESTLPGLVRAIQDYFTMGRRGENDTWT